MYTLAFSCITNKHKLSKVEFDSLHTSISAEMFVTLAEKQNFFYGEIRRMCRSKKRSHRDRETERRERERERGGGVL